MMRSVLLAMMIVPCLASALAAGDAIAPKTLAAIKRATVYIKVESSRASLGIGGGDSKARYAVCLRCLSWVAPPLNW